MKIGLIYQDALTKGGYPRDVRALANALLGIGCDVTLFANLPSETGRTDLADGVPVATLGSLLRSRHRFDVLHVFGLFTPRHAAALMVCAAGSTPLVLSPLSHLQPLALRSSRRRKEVFLRTLAPALRSLDGVHVFSETEAASLARWSSLRERRTFIASLGVYDDHVIPAVRADARRRVVFFGRNDVQQKGIDLIVRGFARFVREGGDPAGTRRLAIGGASYATSDSHIGEVVASENLNGAFDLLGPLSEEEKWQLLREASVFVFMSRFDGPPRPIREALSVGAPCIVSYESNMGELVESFGAGRAAPLEPAGIAGCLHEAFASPETLGAWKAGASRLRAELAWPNVARTYLAGYESIGVTNNQARRTSAAP